MAAVIRQCLYELRAKAWLDKFRSGFPSEDEHLFRSRVRRASSDTSDSSSIAETLIELAKILQRAEGFDGPGERQKWMLDYQDFLPQSSRESWRDAVAMVSAPILGSAGARSMARTRQRSDEGLPLAKKQKAAEQKVVAEKAAAVEAEARAMEENQRWAAVRRSRREAAEERAHLKSEREARTAAEQKAAKEREAMEQEQYEEEGQEDDTEEEEEEEEEEEGEAMCEWCGSPAIETCGRSPTWLCQSCKSSRLTQCAAEKADGNRCKVDSTCSAGAPLRCGALFCDHHRHRISISPPSGRNRLDGVVFYG